MSTRVARAPLDAGPRGKPDLAPPSASSLSTLRSHYILLDRVGSGCVGTVMHAVEKATRLDVAIKVVPKALLLDKPAKRALAREVSVLEKVSHPNVIDFTTAFEDEKFVFIATEFFEKGDLYRYLKSKDNGLAEREALKYIRQIFKALQYLHGKGISHRDIKPENVLMGGNGVVKLADFGICYWRRPGGDKNSMEHCGTPQYAAPEIMQRVAYVPEMGDMWACGVLLYAMLTRTLPFVGNNMMDLKRCIVNANADVLCRSRQLAHVSDDTVWLLRCLLQQNPSKRPSAKMGVEMADDALLGVRRVKRTGR